MTGAGLSVGIDQDRLAGDLRALGLGGGDVVLVFCAMSQIGWVSGGAATLAAALREVIGPTGTLVTSTQTAGNSVSSRAFRAAAAGLDAAGIRDLEARIEAFDPARSPAQGVGMLAEHIRRLPGAIRSPHPQVSFAAVGPDAAELMRVHDLDCHLGERSPLARLYERDAVVLLLGVGYDSCSVLHLAEYRLTRPPARRPYRCYVVEHGVRVRRDFLAPHVDDSDFGRLGAALDRLPSVQCALVGGAPSRLFRVRVAVDFAVGWMVENRPP